jgi:hypothetical protein
MCQKAAFRAPKPHRLVFHLAAVGNSTTRVASFVARYSGRSVRCTAATTCNAAPVPRLSGSMITPCPCCVQNALRTGAAGPDGRGSGGRGTTTEISAAVGRCVAPPGTRQCSSGRSTLLRRIGSSSEMLCGTHASRPCSNQLIMAAHVLPLLPDHDQLVAGAGGSTNT